MTHFEDNRFFRALPGSGEAVGRSFVQSVGKTQSKFRVGHARSKSESHVERLQARKARKCSYHHRPAEDKAKKTSRGSGRHAAAEARSSVRKDEDDDIIASIVGLYRGRDAQRENASSTSSTSTATSRPGNLDAELAANGGTSDGGNREAGNHSGEQRSPCNEGEAVGNAVGAGYDFWGTTFQDGLRSFEDIEDREGRAQPAESVASASASAAFPTSSGLEAPALANDSNANGQQQSSETASDPCRENQQCCRVHRGDAVFGNAEGEVSSGPQEDRQVVDTNYFEDETNGCSLAQLSSGITLDDVSIDLTLAFLGVKRMNRLSAKVLGGRLGLEAGALDDIDTRLRRLRRPVSNSHVCDLSEKTRAQQNMCPDVDSMRPEVRKTISKSDDEMWIGRKPFKNDSRCRLESKPRNEEKAFLPEEKRQTDSDSADSTAVKSRISSSSQEEAADIEIVTSDLENFAAWAFAALDANESDDKDSSRGSNDVLDRVNLHDVVEFLNEECGSKLSVSCPCEGLAQDRRHDTVSAENVEEDGSLGSRDACCGFQRGCTDYYPEESALLCDAGKRPATTHGDNREWSTEYTSSEELGENRADHFAQDIPRKNDTRGRKSLISTWQNSDEQKRDCDYDHSSASRSPSESENSVDEDDLADNEVCKCRWQSYLVQDANTRNKGFSDTWRRSQRRNRGEEKAHSFLHRGVQCREVLHDVSSSSEETSQKMPYHGGGRKSRAGMQTRRRAIHWEDEKDSSVCVSSSEGDSIDSHGYSRVSARDFLGHLEDVPSSSSSCCGGDFLERYSSDSSGSSWNSSGTELICTEFYREHLGWVPPITEDELLRRSHLERLEQSFLWEQELQRLWMGVEENDESSGRRWRKGKKPRGAMRFAGDNMDEDSDSLYSGESDAQNLDWEVEGSGYAADVNEDSCASDPGCHGEPSVIWSECECAARAAEMPASTMMDGSRSSPTPQMCVLNAMNEYSISSTKDNTDEEIIPEYLFREEGDASKAEANQGAGDIIDPSLDKTRAERSSPLSPPLSNPSQDDRNSRQGSNKSTDIGTDYYSVMECTFEDENGRKRKSPTYFVVTTDSEFTTASDSDEPVSGEASKEDEATTETLGGSEPVSGDVNKEDEATTETLGGSEPVSGEASKEDEATTETLGGSEPVSGEASKEDEATTETLGGSEPVSGEVSKEDEAATETLGGSEPTTRGQSREEATPDWNQKQCHENDVRNALISESFSKQEKDASERHAREDVSHPFIGKTDLSDESKDSPTYRDICGKSLDSREDYHVSEFSPSINSREESTAGPNWLRVTDELQRLNTNSNAANTDAGQMSHLELSLGQSRRSNSKHRVNAGERPRRLSTSRKPGERLSSAKSESRMGTTWQRQSQHMETSLALSEFSSIAFPYVSSPQRAKAKGEPAPIAVNTNVEEIPTLKEMQEQQLSSSIRLAGIKTKSNSVTVPLQRQASGAKRQVAKPMTRTKYGSLIKSPSNTDKPRDRVLSFDYSRRTVPRHPKKQTKFLSSPFLATSATPQPLRTLAQSLLSPRKRGRRTEAKDGNEDCFDTPWTTNKRFDVYKDIKSLHGKKMTQGMNIGRHPSQKKQSLPLAPYYEQVLDRRYRVAGSALHDVTVDSQGHLYVADTDASLVYRLPSYGMGEYGTREVFLGPRESIDRPWSVYVDRQRSTLYVSQLNGIVKVFRLPTEASPPDPRETHDWKS